jgi:hypothetical protein
MLEKFQAGKLDPTNQHRLNDELALWDLLVSSELERIATGATDRRMMGMRELAEIAMVRQRAGDHDQATAAMEQLYDALTAEVASFTATDRLARFLEKRRLAADTERKNISTAANSMPIEGVQRLGGATFQAVADVVKDRRVVQEIADRIRVIMGATFGEAEEPSQNRVSRLKEIAAAESAPG